MAMTLLFFATASTAGVIALGAVAGMLPDLLQFVYSLYPQEPLKSLQRFHGWVHSKRKLAWKIGVVSQLAFAAGVSGVAIACLNFL
jgi:hypothetical protein